MFCLCCSLMCPLCLHSVWHMVLSGAWVVQGPLDAVTLEHDSASVR